MHDHEYIEQVQDRINLLYQDLKIHGGKLQTPQGRALTETASEVLGGIKKAFEHYLTRAEEAWQD